MIIWINGAFGAGKTQTAYGLQRRLPGSYVYDPENAGFFIRENLPLALRLDDFQDYPMWRALNVAMLDNIAERFPGDIIVPMTITDQVYYDEIIGTLSKKYGLHHFILNASKETLLKRLASRFEGDTSWTAQQIDRCIEAFEETIPGHKIDTDDMSLEQVVEKVAELSGIKLLEDHRNFLRKKIDRIVIQCKHVR